MVRLFWDKLVEGFRRWSRMTYGGGAEMSAEYFLVFRGDVAYCPRLRRILCLDPSQNECMIIRLPRGTRVITHGGEERTGFADTYDRIYHKHYHGNELWADGERYWVR